MTTLPGRVSILLVPGHWLGAWAWEAVTSSLRDKGYDVTPVTLPGLDGDDPGRAGRTILEQADALERLVRDAACEGVAVVLVAHSGAGTPTSVILDRDPTCVSRVVYVDSGPLADGGVFDPDAPTDLLELPLPPFDELGRRASLDGLSPEQLTRFRELAVPEPGPVVTGATALGNDARRDVPTTIVCSSYPSDVMMQMAPDGHPMLAEVATLRDLDLVDLPTGHWPMWSRPDDLADAIADAAGR